jgi:hypothetical protein
MRASQDELGSPRRWGGLGVTGARTFSDGHDGRCDSPHWGYVVRGALRVSYPDHEEVVVAGDAYYVAPGHLGIALQDAELVDFSPSGATVPGPGPAVAAPTTEGASRP